MPREPVLLALVLLAISSPEMKAQNEPEPPEPAAERVAEAERAAEAAAREWLALVDAGEYGSSWDHAAAAFQAAVAREAWVAQIGEVRAPVDPLGERTLFFAQYRATLPSAPPGEYVVLQFRTDMADGGAVVETVTPMREADGPWKVSGYFIRRM